MSILGLCYYRGVCVDRFSTRRGNLGSDHINELRRARRQFPMRFLRGLAQNSSPVGNRSFREASLLVVDARHARVEVDLLVSGEHTIVHECASFSLRKSE